jgi:hypothetical protein
MDMLYLAISPIKPDISINDGCLYLLSQQTPELLPSAAEFSKAII